MIKPSKTALAALAIAGTLAGGPVWSGGSSASSASSEAGSASLGSISTSFQGSSNSSSKGTDVAAGEYRLIEVADAGPRADDALRLKLQAVAGSGAEGEFFLFVPRITLDRHGVAAGQLLTARARPYGVEFALGTPRQAFFLLVTDDWYRELRTTAVTL